MGLGSILGTGIFVSFGIAAGIAGPSVLVAVVLGAAVAACNGLSSAQLAASHPVSGGTYEYGYRYLGPTLGFAAGWMFLCAKTASAATAALGFGGYALAALGIAAPAARIGVAVAAVAALTAVVAGGMTRSSRTNAVIVAVTLGALAAFVIAGAGTAVAGTARFDGALGGAGARELLHATALVFVAFTGYGRIATLGEEVREPARTIPRAIVLALLATLAIYAAVIAVAVGVLGAGPIAEATRATGAPLEAAAARLPVPEVRYAVAAGAIAAMLGVLLNLLLGLSRVVLAMARRGDLPPALAHVDARLASPRRAVVATGAAIGALALIGSVRATWSFSAFTVLIYYAITNAAALRLPAAHRRYPRWVAVLGLCACLGLAFWVEPAVWLTGLSLAAAGLLWHRAGPPRRWRRARAA
jgi:APA family basic amino acid/polyamine antiporter